MTIITAPISPSSPEKSPVKFPAATMATEDLRLPPISVHFKDIIHCPVRRDIKPHSPPVTPDEVTPGWSVSPTRKRERDDEHFIVNKRRAYDSAPLRPWSSHQHNSPVSREPYPPTSSSSSGVPTAHAMPTLPGLRNALPLVTSAAASYKSAPEGAPYSPADSRRNSESVVSRIDDLRSGPPRLLPPIVTAPDLGHSSSHINTAHPVYGGGSDPWSHPSRYAEERSWDRLERRASEYEATRTCIDCERRGVHHCPHIATPRSTLPPPVGHHGLPHPHDEYRRSIGYDGRPLPGSSQYQWEMPGVPSDHASRRRRGNLPKESTAILNAWFCSHSSYPYPKEEEKQALQAATGLTMAQISNWFINARRRRRPVPSSKDDKAASNL